MVCSELEALVAELCSELRRIYGDRLRGVYLYGSCARGQEQTGSDVDVAVVLDDFSSHWAEIKRTGPQVSQLSLKYDVSISLYRVRQADWERSDSPLLSNIRAEGIALILPSEPESNSNVNRQPFHALGSCSLERHAAVGSFDFSTCVCPMVA